LRRVFSGLAIVAVFVVVALGRFVGSDPGTPPQYRAPATWTERLWSGGLANAERHWQKHGGEFPEFGSRDAYIAGAHSFIDHPPAGTLTKVRVNGDTLFYNPGSNTFAVRAANGAPRTFFRPDNGMAYWERQ
jgi:filamentous hemagglutinin